MTTPATETKARPGLRIGPTSASAFSSGRLEVTCAVDNPVTLTLDSLRAMPSVTRVVTLECAGNGRLGQTPLPVGELWGGCAVSASRWTGARLHEVRQLGNVLALVLPSVLGAGLGWASVATVSSQASQMLSAECFRPCRSAVRPVRRH